MTSLNSFRTLAASLALALSVGPTSGCLLSWERDEAAGGGGGGTTAQTSGSGGSCNFECGGATACTAPVSCPSDCGDCQVACTGGGCVVQCNDATSCSVGCTGTDPCEVHCGSAASCDVSCFGGNCIVSGEQAGSVTLACNGSAGSLSCDQATSCDLTVISSGTCSCPNGGC